MELRWRVKRFWASRVREAICLKRVRIDELRRYYLWWGSGNGGEIFTLGSGTILSDGLEGGDTLGSDTIMSGGDGEDNTIWSDTISLAILVGTSANEVVALEEYGCEGVDVIMGEVIVSMRLSKVVNWVRALYMGSPALRAGYVVDGGCLKFLLDQ